MCDASRCYTLAGVRKVKVVRGYTISSGSIKTMGMMISSVAGVYLVTLATPGGRVSNVRLRLAAVGAWQALISSHSGDILAVFGSWPLIISLSKARTFSFVWVALS